MSLLIRLVTRFGGPKVAVAAFLMGASLTIPAVMGTHFIWNGVVKSKQIKALKQTGEDQRHTIRLQQAEIKANARIVARKDQDIEKLEEDNRTLSKLNMEFAQSRAPVTERIVERGQEIKQEVSLTDKCAATDINDKLRQYGNGSDFDPAALFPFAQGN